MKPLHIYESTFGRIGWKVPAVVLILFTLSVGTMALQSTTQAAATTIYADGNLPGNCLSHNYSIAARNCSGSDGNAYRKVIDALAAVGNAGGALDGSTILVRAGTYREATFWLTRPLTLKAYGSESVTLTYNPANPPRAYGQYAQIMIVSGNNVTIQGFTIRGTKPLGDNASTDYDIDIAINDNVSNTTIRNNRIYDGGHAGVKPSGATGSYVIENNEFYNIGFTTRDHGIYSPSSTTGAKIIRYNEFHNISGWGIHIYSNGKYHQIYGNIVHHSNGGILLTGDHNTVYNNVIANNGALGGLTFFHYGLTNITVKNNIMWNNSGVDLICTADNAGAAGRSFANNIVGTRSYTCPYWNTVAVNTLTSNPLFVSASPAKAADYKLQNTSPAAGAGVNLGSPYNMELNPASGGVPFGLVDENAFGAWEIGAFVSASAGAHASALQPLAATTSIPKPTNTATLKPVTKTATLKPSNTVTPIQATKTGTPKPTNTAIPKTATKPPTLTPTNTATPIPPTKTPTPKP